MSDVLSPALIEALGPDWDHPRECALVCTVYPLPIADIRSLLVDWSRVKLGFRFVAQRLAFGLFQEENSPWEDVTARSLVMTNEDWADELHSLTLLPRTSIRRALVQLLGFPATTEQLRRRLADLREIAISPKIEVTTLRRLRRRLPRVPLVSEWGTVCSHLADYQWAREDRPFAEPDATTHEVVYRGPSGSSLWQKRPPPPPPPIVFKPITNFPGPHNSSGTPMVYARQMTFTKPEKKSSTQTVLSLEMKAPPPRPGLKALVFC